MKLFLMCLPCLSVAACVFVNEPASPPPGMPLDKQHKPFGGDDRIVTRTAAATNSKR